MTLHHGDWVALVRHHGAEASCIGDLRMDHHRQVVRRAIEMMQQALDETAEWEDSNGDTILTEDGQVPANPANRKKYFPNGVPHRHRAA